MLEKVYNNAAPPPYPWNLRSILLLMTSVFLAMLLLLSIDSCTVRNLIHGVDFRRDIDLISPPLNYTRHRDNITSTTTTTTTTNSAVINITSAANATAIAAVTHLHTHNRTETPATPHWISVQLEHNFTANLISRWSAPGGELCRESKTEDIIIPNLDTRNPMKLSTGDIHEFVFHAVDSAGNRLCLGGDYFETQLSGDSWKSRPPVKDFGNGTYSFSLQVHQDFPGDYDVIIILLFRHFEGLKFSTKKFIYDKKVRKFQVQFYKNKVTLPTLHNCDIIDFTRDVWSGRWTRHGRNDDCEISHDGRYRCLRPDFPCDDPWCHGSLGSLESNGWVYSTHCSFKIFSSESAWRCLNNQWIFFWGDSNHVDTIRNLLNFVLDLWDVKSVPRRFDTKFINPRDSTQWVRITSIFNGHWNETLNYEGLNSLRNNAFQELVKGYFMGDTVPDAVIMNSGLHDGIFWPNLRRFARGAEYAAGFWAEVMEGLRRRGLVVPKVMYRTTVATGGYARALSFNPSKMEAFNGVVVEKFRAAGVVSSVIDGFDMTFPWHFDNRCNDGVHYGRGPAKVKWRDGEIGHQYFVDLMLAHVLLNALCAT